MPTAFIPGNPLTVNTATLDREVVQQTINAWDAYWQGGKSEVDAIEFVLRMNELRTAMAQRDCWCTTCRSITVADMRFVVCPDCGNKRCPKAHNHLNACTNSNDIGQPGSSWSHVKKPNSN